MKELIYAHTNLMPEKHLGKFPQRHNLMYVAN
mgnify:CR=1 FL=1